MREKRNIKCYAPSLALALCFIILFSLPVMAAEKGYTYDDPNLAYYTSVEHNGEKLFCGTGRFNISSDDGSVATSELGVQIWSDNSYANADLLQQDFYETTVTGLPTGELARKYEKKVLNDEEYTYYKEAKLYTPSSQELTSNMLGNPEQYMTYIFPRDEKNRSEEGYEFTAEKITYAGYPAVITRKYMENVDESGGFSISCYGSIFVYITDMPMLPMWFMQDTIGENETLTLKEKYEKIGACYAALEIGYSYSASTYGIQENQAFLEARARELFAEAENDFKSIHNDFDKSIVFETKKTMDIRVKNYKPGGSRGSIDTDADDKSGEAAVSIPAALAIVIIGGISAIAGAGTGGSGGDGVDNSRKKKSRYKMCLRKDFGDAIRYDARPVTVYARIVEITSEGEEIDRPDLTASIDIFSGGNLTVEGNSMAGNYMGALVSAESVTGGQNPDSGILSIKFSGEGGSFQNNVTFRLIGKPYISLTGPNLYVLAGSGEKFIMPVELIDFMEPPANIVLEGDPLPITLEQNEEGGYYLEVVDDTPKPETNTKFYEEIPYTISADSGDETIQARFTVLKCYEGLLADFLGKENEIMAYKNEDGEMPITNIGFQAGLWNSEQKRLDLIAPEQMEMSYEDKEGIYELIGLSYEQNIDLSTSQHTVYSFTAKKSLPSPDKIVGTLAYSSQIGDIRMENEATIYLIPDLLTYAKDFEQEYENCLRIIYTYMSGELMKRKADELYRDKNKLGLEDLKLFRKHCWEIASRMIMQEKEDYMQDVYWYDERIAELELTVFVGDVAFALAITPYGGPITSFLADNLKSTFLELCEEYVKKGDIFTLDTLQEIIWNRFKQAIGSVDNFISMPENATPKQMVAWVCSFYLYRVFYHWHFDEDEAGNSLGLYAALENSLKDLLINRSMAILGDYVKEVAKKDGIDFSKRIKAEEDAVKTALVGAFDMADIGADLLDDAVGEIADFIKRIQIV